MIEPGLHPVPAGHLATVVTWLEMTAPPAPRTAPPPEGARVALWDAPGRDDYRELIRRIGTDWLWSSRLRLTDAALGEVIRHSDVEVWRLMRGEVPLGIAELDFRKAPDCELAFFGVAPEAVRTTAARHLMTAATARAWKRPIARLFRIPAPSTARGRSVSTAVRGFATTPAPWRSHPIRASTAPCPATRPPSRGDRMTADEGHRHPRPRPAPRGWLVPRDLGRRGAGPAVRHRDPLPASRGGRGATGTGSTPPKSGIFTPALRWSCGCRRPRAGPAARVLLGPDLARERPQVIVPAHHWQSAECTGEWTLAGCTVSPGFRFEGFELAPPDFDIPEA